MAHKKQGMEQTNRRRKRRHSFAGASYIKKHVRLTRRKRVKNQEADQEGRFKLLDDAMKRINEQTTLEDVVNRYVQEAKASPAWERELSITFRANDCSKDVLQEAKQFFEARGFLMKIDTEHWGGGVTVLVSVEPK